MNRRKFFGFLAAAPVGVVATPKAAPEIAVAWQEALDAGMFKNLPGALPVLASPLKPCLKCGYTMSYQYLKRDICVWCRTPRLSPEFAAKDRAFGGVDDLLS